MSAPVMLATHEWPPVGTDAGACRAGRRARARHHRLVADLVARRAGAGRPRLACDRHRSAGPRGEPCHRRGRDGRVPRGGSRPDDRGHWSRARSTCWWGIRSVPPYRWRSSPIGRSWPGGWCSRIRRDRIGAAMPNSRPPSSARSRAARADPESEVRRELAQNPTWLEEDARQNVEGRALCDVDGVLASLRGGTGLRVVELAPNIGVPTLYILADEQRIGARRTAFGAGQVAAGRRTASSSWIRDTRCIAIASMPTWTPLSPGSPMTEPTLTLRDVRGLRVGHATNESAVTGCTVVLATDGAVAGVDVRGAAPGTRETDLLRPGSLVERIHAVCLAGGSAFGLAAADGVMSWLAERGIGFPTEGGPVPIVPAAILYDLGIGRADVRPTAADGVAACDAAERGDGPVEGSVGAGTGATVAKLSGPEGTRMGGVGMAGRALRMAATCLPRWPSATRSAASWDATVASSRVRRRLHSRPRPHRTWSTPPWRSSPPTPTSTDRNATAWPSSATMRWRARSCRSIPSSTEIRSSRSPPAAVRQWRRASSWRSASRRRAPLRGDRAERADRHFTRRRAGSRGERLVLRARPRSRAARRPGILYTCSSAG